MRAKPGILAADIVDQRFEALHRKIAARQRRSSSPVAVMPRLGRYVPVEFGKRMLRQPAIGGDLTAEDRQHRWSGFVEIENVVAGGPLGLFRAVVVKGPTSGLRHHH